jgi:hypothetical protein
MLFMFLLQLQCKHFLAALLLWVPLIPQPYIEVLFLAMSISVPHSNPYEPQLELRLWQWQAGA